MTKAVLPLAGPLMMLGGLLTASMAMAQPAQPPMPHFAAHMPTTLSISATGTVTAEPDLAQIGAGVVTQATEANAALQENAQRMSRVIAALKRAGIAERDIRTSRLSVQPQFRYQQNESPTLTGFKASNRVDVTLRDLKSAGRVIDALVSEGANQIDGPNFQIDKPEPLLDKARADAVRIARSRAELYASAAGLKVKRILSISEGNASSPVPPPFLQRAVAMEAKADSPVMAGESELSVTVNVTFELDQR